ncbi:MAG: P63C domain-containing protein [Candidatus Aquilonibacter sp.]|jgi:hypothetical protein
MDNELFPELRAQEPGRARGGRARAKALPANRRSEIAKSGAVARWDPNVRIAEYGDDEHPLSIGGTRVACYVLDNGERVLSQRGFFDALGITSRGKEMERLISHARLDLYLSAEAINALLHPIRFKQPRGGKLANSYSAPLLIDVCNAILTSRDKRTCSDVYAETIIRSDVMVRAVAKVGIVALVDEATGYEKERAANSLAQILEAFIAKELQPYVMTFPAEFYSELFRLRGLPFPTGKVQRPQFFGHLTNDIIYRRLAPGVLDELKRVSPKNAKGKRKGKLFQMLTANIGYPKLREHMGAVVTMMQLTKTYQDFKVVLDRLRPAYGSTIPLPFPPDEMDDDTGLGL